MTTEDKIKEAFEVHKRSMDIEDLPQFIDFKAGYMACLNSLEPTNLICNTHMLYRLPEGVKR